MTTIAYKDGVIAYDSRFISGNIITYDDAEKKIEKDGAVFFTTGVFSDAGALIDLYFNKSKDHNIDIAALVVENKQVFQLTVEDERLHKYAIDMNKPFAIGSGRDHAWTAMDLGHTPKKAIEMAIMRDWGSGGEVRVFNVDN